MAAVYADDRRDETIAQINITPLVDVMLVLLVIFMIAAPTLTKTLPMRLPGPTPGPVTPAKPMRLEVTSQGDFLLDGRMLAEPALRAALGDVALKAPETVLRVHASDDSDYQAFTTALAAAHASGLANLSVE
jgi:biopolymer transport protein ExbD